MIRKLKAEEGESEDVQSMYACASCSFRNLHTHSHSPTPKLKRERKRGSIHTTLQPQRHATLAVKTNDGPELYEKLELLNKEKFDGNENPGVES